MGDCYLKNDQAFILTLLITSIIGYAMGSILSVLMYLSTKSIKDGINKHVGLVSEEEVEHSVLENARIYHVSNEIKEARKYLADREDEKISELRDSYYTFSKKFPKPKDETDIENWNKQYLACQKAYLDVFNKA